MASGLARLGVQGRMSLLLSSNAPARYFASKTPDLFPLEDVRDDRFGPRVHVPEGGNRVSTADVPNPMRYSLMEPSYGMSFGSSVRDPMYEYGSSNRPRPTPKAFAGWDPRSFGNSLGSSLRDPLYEVTQKKVK